MKILVADQNALLLAAITATFGPHCDLVTATRRDGCITQLEQHRFDVVVACDKLSDYTGLELLSEVGAISPDTLLIFAANPKRLSQLGKRLAMFGLFAVLSYPITPRKLLDVLKRARQSLRTPKKPKVRHVVLESEWDTGVRLGLVEKDLQAQAEAAGRTEHDAWPAGPEVAVTGAHVAAMGAIAKPGVEADDFVFSGPPVVSPVTESPAPSSRAESPRAESRARTFEATPVAPRMALDANARGTPDASEVIEYEVKPVALALTHDAGTIACDDEFIFASSEAMPVSARAAAAEIRKVEPAPSIDDFCSNDPLFDVPEPPRWAEDGAANDTAYEPRPAAASAPPGANGSHLAASHEVPKDSGSHLAAARIAPTDSESQMSRPSRPAHADAGHESEASGPAGAKGSHASNSTRSPQAKSATRPPSPKPGPQRRTRTQTVPTEAQRAAFERAVARRNAERGAPAAAPFNGKARHRQGGARTEPTIQAAGMEGLFAGTPSSERSSKSLAELARMATRKRPLSGSAPNLNKSARPNRAVYAVGSGLAAVVILGVISFELLRNSSHAEHHMARAPATSTQLFSSRTMMLDNNQGTGVPQFGPPIQQAATSQEASPPNEPEAQTFDPNTAPEDPPPPPAVEQPGPMEPPSEDIHTGPPLGMIQGDGATESE